MLFKNWTGANVSFPNANTLANELFCVYNHCDHLELAGKSIVTAVLVRIPHWKCEIRKVLPNKLLPLNSEQLSMEKVLQIRRQNVLNVFHQCNMIALSKRTEVNDLMCHLKHMCNRRKQT